MRAKSWLATIQPIPLTDIMYWMHCKELWIVMTKSMDLSSALHYFLLKELQAVEQLVELKAYPLRAREAFEAVVSLSKTIGCLRERWENQAPQKATAI